jgi:hypothetical protein
LSSFEKQWGTKANIDVGSSARVSLDEYWTMDVPTTKRLRYAMLFYARLTHLTDEYSTEIIGYPETGLNMEGGMKLQAMLHLIDTIMDDATPSSLDAFTCIRTQMT